LAFEDVKQSNPLLSEIALLGGVEPHPEAKWLCQILPECETM